MKQEKIYEVKVYLRHHLFASYILQFSSEEGVQNFITEINNDIDFVVIGEECIRRSAIRKLVIR